MLNKFSFIGGVFMRRSGTLDVTVSSHGIIWWLLIGIWYRPLSLIFWFILARIGGYKYVRFTKR
jgi:hypothetical protein